VPGTNREVLGRFLSSWIVSRLIPAPRVKPPDLARALAAVGEKPPARRSIYGTNLDALHEHTLESVSSPIREQNLVHVIMDGWKKMAVEQGASLVTISFLLADGCPIFYKVCAKSLLHIAYSCNNQFISFYLTAGPPKNKAFTISHVVNDQR
jgi:hypothetical protein